MIWDGRKEAQGIHMTVSQGMHLLLVAGQKKLALPLEARNVQNVQGQELVIIQLQYINAL